MGNTLLCFSRGSLFLGCLPRSRVWGAAQGARRATGVAPQTRGWHSRPRVRPGSPRALQLLPLQSRQQNRTEPDPPALLVLLQAHRLARQHLTKKHNPVAPMRCPRVRLPAATGSDSDTRSPPAAPDTLVAEGTYTLAGVAHPQRLVRPLLVVVLLEALEGPLLPSRRRTRRTRRLLLQGAVQTLVPPVLLRMARLDAHRAAAQSQATFTLSTGSARALRSDKRRLRLRRSATPGLSPLSVKVACDWAAARCASSRAIREPERRGTIASRRILEDRDGATSAIAGAEVSFAVDGPNQRLGSRGSRAAAARGAGDGVAVERVGEPWRFENPARLDGSTYPRARPAAALALGERRATIRWRQFGHCVSQRQVLAACSVGPTAEDERRCAGDRPARLLFVRDWSGSNL